MMRDMAMRPANRASEWDPKYVGIGMVGFTACMIGAVNLAPHLGFGRSGPHMFVADSGVGDPGLPGETNADPRTGSAVMKIAAWATVRQDPPPDGAEVLSRSVRVIDEKGDPWPARISYETDGFTVLVPEGYRRVPVTLLAEVTTAGEPTVRVKLPPLPDPPPVPKPKLTSRWRGMSFRLAPADFDRRTRLGLEVSATIPKGHILLATQVGSSSTMAENAAGETPIRVAAAGPPVVLPLRLFYPLATDEVYVRVREMSPKRHRTRVVVEDYTPSFLYGQWWLPSAYRKVRLKDGTEFLLMTPDRQVFRAPSRPRSSVPIYAMSLGNSLIERIDLISPTHLGGKPLRVLWPTTWSAGKTSDYRGGTMDLVFDLEYTVYKQVREATVAVPLRRDEVEPLVAGRN